ncbi:MAG: protein-L-isoaspartate(D-aspartate) O-methyltransferase [Rhodothermales bacterium]|nr:protein-L-isoaspartate(D-aspartate) O-methyltransferase [Rhodothermales bacterium]
MDDWKYKRRRAALVDTIREKGITDDRVLTAIGKIPRHLFVDDALAGRAYLDEALPIGLQQTISQPFTVAYQTERLEIERGDKVLEIGTGSGYQAAVLCELGAKVYSIERQKPLYERTRHLLRRLGYRVTTYYGDGMKGWSTFAPYDAIVVTAGALDVPEALLEQLRLADEQHRGGRLLIPIGDRETQVMTRFEKMPDGSFDRTEMEGFRFVPLLPGDA